MVERAWHVALMGRHIYRRASRVIVWPGKASEHTVSAFHLLFGLFSASLTLRADSLEEPRDRLGSHRCDCSGAPDVFREGGLDCVRAHSADSRCCQSSI